MRIGLLFDRAVEIMFRHRAPIAMTMLPAIAITVLLLGFPYVALPYDAPLDEIMSQVWQTVIVRSFSAFSIWFCCAAVMIGVRWIALGYPPRPFYWLQFALARLPAIASTFAIPVAAGALAVLAISVYFIESAFPAALIELGPHLSLIVFVEAIVLQPSLLIATTVVAAALIDDLSLAHATRSVVMTAWDRAKRWNFTAIIAALCLVNAAAQAFAAFADPYLLEMHMSSVALIVIASLLYVAAAVFSAVVIAVGWLSGYIGPRSAADVRALPTLDAASHAEEKPVQGVTRYVQTLRSDAIEDRSRARASRARPPC